MNLPATHPREEEAAAYVFGHMEAAERIAFVTAMNQDETLRALVDDLNMTAAAMAHATPQIAPPAAVRERVLQSVKALPQDGKARHQPLTSSGSSRYIGWAAAAAFAIMGVMTWEQARTSKRALARTEAEIASLQAATARMEKLLPDALAHSESLMKALTLSSQLNEELKQRLAANEAAAATVKQQLAQTTKANEDLKIELAKLTRSNDVAKMQIATLQSTVKEYQQGVAVVVWNSEKQEGILKLEKMPPVDANKDYQLWVVDPSKKTPVNAGVVRVDEKGFAKVDFKPTLDIQQANNFAISVEKKGGVPENEGPIVLLSP